MVLQTGASFIVFVLACLLRCFIRTQLHAALHTPITPRPTARRWGGARDDWAVEMYNKMAAEAASLNPTGLEAASLPLSETEAAATEPLNLKGLETESLNSTSLETESLNPTGSETESLSPMGSEAEVESLPPSGAESLTPTETEAEAASLNPIGLEAKSLNPIGLETESLNPTGSETESLSPMGSEAEVESLPPSGAESLTPTGLEAKSLNPIGLEAKSLNPIGLETESLSLSGSEAESLNPIGLEMESLTPTGLEMESEDVPQDCVASRYVLSVLVPKTANPIDRLDQSAFLTRYRAYVSLLSNNTLQLPDGALQQTITAFSPEIVKEHVARALRVAFGSAVVQDGSQIRTTPTGLVSNEVWIVWTAVAGTHSLEDVQAAAKKLTEFVRVGLAQDVVTTIEAVSLPLKEAEAVSVRQTLDVTPLTY